MTSFDCPEPIAQTSFLRKHKKTKAENRDQEIAELEKFFASVTLPISPIKLNAYSTITDVQKFISGHMGYLKADNGHIAILPYFERLQALKKILTG